MSKHTAVEWLLDRYIQSSGIISIEDIQQAKAMERQQIVEAVQEGYDIDRSLHNWKWVGLEYYKETYEKEANHEG